LPWFSILLDSYKAVLLKTIAAMNGAYPCNDATKNNPRPNSGDEPQKILSGVPAARQACLAWLNATPLPVRNAPPPASGNVRRQVSCSTITSSSDTPEQRQTQQHCSDAGHALLAARNVRKDYPLLTKEADAHYRKAADSYTKAGDLEQAALTLLEMAAPSIVFPNYDEKKLAKLADAAFHQNYGRTLEDENRTCYGLDAAADNYAEAADAFAAANENDKARELKRKSDEVHQFVAKAQRENRCTTGRPQPTPAGKQDTDRKQQDDDKKKCDAAQAEVDDLYKRAAFLENLGTIGQPPSQEAVDARNEADAKQKDLVSQGCK
jgi:hypothetical protein